MRLEQTVKFCDEKCITYSLNEPMSLHTSFKIGGPADIFITPKNSEELKLIIKQLTETSMPYFILGKGSNILVSDDGIEGAVIALSEIREIEIFEDKITVGAGASLSELCRAAAEGALTGIEFAYGIPGSVGGALYMNAGAYGGEMSNVAFSAEVINDDGEIYTISADDMKLGYRSSIFNSNGLIIIRACFKLKFGNKADIEAAMEDYISRRKHKQPLEYPSAGSTFKRPQGYFAGALIEKNNLKGLSVGGAEVSEKHAGFIINKHAASCNDVLNLIEKVKEAVLKADGISLEPEVIFVGKR